MQGATDPAPAAEPMGRRLYLTVLFADLSDSTRLGEALEAEDYAAMLNAVRRLCRDIVTRHGGHIARLQGDGLLAIFGYPNALEDDGRRATEVALELHDAVGRLVVARTSDGHEPLKLHSGIHSGLVYLLEGSIELGRFEIVGSVPNTAAGLSDLAGSGEIVVSEETLGPQADFFATSATESVRPKGAKQLLAVRRVLGRAVVQRTFEARARRGLVPFIGRELPTGVLRREMQAALTGEARCIAVVGEAGIGKTRFIEEILATPTAQRFRILRGYCESYLGAEPLQPFVQIERSLALDGEPAASTVAAGELPQTLPSQIDRMTTTRPVLVAVDDWQWADDASRQMLDSIRRLQGAVCVVLGTRTMNEEVIAGLPMRTVELAPLNFDEAEQTMKWLLPGADPFVVSDIHRHAGGNPLFMEELCHNAVNEGLDSVASGGRARMAWMDALIVSRVARLTPAEANLLSSAAVLGNIFPASLLEKLTGCGEGHPLMLALAEGDFLFPSSQVGILRFKHGITREVVYSAIGLQQRRSIHQRVASALTANPDVLREESFGALAYHFDGANDPAKAAHYYELAGDKSMNALALDRARDQYSAGLRALDAQAPLSAEQLLQWCALSGKLGMACVFDPLGVVDGVALFARAVSMARATGDAAAIARAEYWMGYICYARGLPREAAVHCERSLATAVDGNDQRLVDQVRATLGQVLVATGDYERAIPLLDAAVSGKRRQATTGNRIAVGSAYALACKGCLLGDRGDFGLAQECFDESLRLLGDSVHQVASSVAGWIAASYQWQGRWKEALNVALTGERIAQNVHSRQLLAMNRALSGYASWTLTGQTNSVQTIREATSWIERSNGAFFTSLNYGWLVDCAVALGKQDEARRYAALLYRRVRQSDCLGEGMGTRALARSSSRQGNPAHALRLLVRSDRAAQARGSRRELAMNHLCRGRMLLEQGFARDATQSLDAAEAAFEAMAMPWYATQVKALRA